MTTTKLKGDLHIPTWTLNNFIRRWFGKPNRYNDKVSPGQVVADLGSGPGFYTFALADAVGPTGKVYAVDSDEKAIRVIDKKAQKEHHHNIETHACSAAHLDFIADGSIDFVLGDGLLCCVAIQDHADTVREIKRILKTDGKAFLASGRDSLSRMEDAEWEEILKQFVIDGRNNMPYKGDRWAWVRKG